MQVLKDREVLLAHFDFPADHEVHLRTTNAIESSFATVRLRTRKTKGAGSGTAGLAMAYKVLAAAQARWRSVNAPWLSQPGLGVRHRREIAIYDWNHHRDGSAPPAGVALSAASAIVQPSRPRADRPDGARTDQRGR
jgi:hypothetical protein